MIETKDLTHKTTVKQRVQQLKQVNLTGSYKKILFLQLLGLLLSEDNKPVQNWHKIL